MTNVLQLQMLKSKNSAELVLNRTLDSKIIISLSIKYLNVTQIASEQIKCLFSVLVNIFGGYFTVYITLLVVSCTHQIASIKIKRTLLRMYPIRLVTENMFLPRSVDFKM